MSRGSSPDWSPIIQRVSFVQTAHAQLNSSHQLQKSFNESRTGVEGLMSNFLTQLGKAEDTSEQKEIMRAYIVQFKEEMDEIEAQFAAIGEAYTDLARQEEELNERDTQLYQLAKELESKEQQVTTEQSNLQAIKKALEDLKTQLIQAVLEAKDKF